MKLLIIDDDPNEIKLMHLALWKDAEVQSVMNASEAVAMLSCIQFDLCLVDLRLGAGESGVDVVKQCPSVPFIVVTNFPEDEARMAEGAALANCMGFCSKEFSGSGTCAVHFKRMLNFAVLKFHANQRHE